MKHIQIETGLNVRLLQTEKFKTNVIAVLLRTPLEKETATKNALLAGILSMGTSKFGTKREIAMECERLYGAVFEISVIKKGEEQIIQLYLEILNDKFSPCQNLLEQAGTLLRSALFEPYTELRCFSESYTEIQKKILAAEIQSKINDKSTYALERCITHMCDNERFAIAKEGYLEDLNNLNNINMFEYYEELLIKAPIEIGIVGSIDEAMCANWAKKNFTRGTIKLNLELPVYKAVYPKKEKIICENINIVQGKLVIGARCGMHSIGKGFYALMLLSEILGGGSDSRLFKTVREKYGLCYYISSFIFRAKSILIIQAGIDNNDYDKVVSLIKDELLTLKTKIVSDQELQGAKKSLINHFDTDSPQKLMDIYLSDVFAGNIESGVSRQKIIKNTSAEDIKSIANEITVDTIYFCK